MLDVWGLHEACIRGGPQVPSLPPPLLPGPSPHLRRGHHGDGAAVGGHRRSRPVRRLGLAEPRHQAAHVGRQRRALLQQLAHVLKHRVTQQVKQLSRHLVVAAACRAQSKAGSEGKGKGQLSSVSRWRGCSRWGKEVAGGSEDPER